jgi:hypothetical protein
MHSVIYMLLFQIVAAARYPDSYTGLDDKHVHRLVYNCIRACVNHLYHPCADIVHIKVKVHVSSRRDMLATVRMQPRTPVFARVHVSVQDEPIYANIQSPPS